MKDYKIIYHFRNLETTENMYKYSKTMYTIEMKLENYESAIFNNEYNKLLTDCVEALLEDDYAVLYGLGGCQIHLVDTEFNKFLILTMEDKIIKSIDIGEIWEEIICGDNREEEIQHKLRTFVRIHP